MQHPFWLILFWACMAWYLLITAYIAIRGAMDVAAMLRNIRNSNKDQN